MNVTLDEGAELKMRFLREDDRRTVGAWIDYLREWESNPIAKRYSRKLAALDDTYVLSTNTDLRIFYTLKKDAIVVLDFARQSLLDRMAQTVEADEA